MRSVAHRAPAVLTFAALTLAIAAPNPAAFAETAGDSTLIVSDNPFITPDAPFVTTAPDSGATPSAAALALVRQRTGRHPIRVWCGSDGYEIRRASIDSTGVAFRPRDQRGLSAWERRGANGDNTRPQPLPSPIAWSRISRLERQRPSGIRGAFVGAVLVPAACLAAIAVGGQWRDFADPNPDAHVTRVLVVGGGALVGAVLGSAIGAFVPHSERVWPIVESANVRWGQL
jgi:hypothetical protein